MASDQGKSVNNATLWGTISKTSNVENTSHWTIRSGMVYKRLLQNVKWYGIRSALPSALWYPTQKCEWSLLGQSRSLLSLFESPLGFPMCLAENDFAGVNLPHSKSCGSHSEWYAYITLTHYPLYWSCPVGPCKCPSNAYLVISVVTNVPGMSRSSDLPSQ